jgi:hypothetical protein
VGGAARSIRIEGRLAFHGPRPGTVFLRAATGHRMSPPGRPKGEYRSAQRAGTPVTAGLRKAC